jgi:hypothetical protein
MAKSKPTTKKTKTKKKKKTEVKEVWSYSDWYEKNKGTLAARRKDRYESDPEYRDRVLEQNRKHRDKKRKEEAKKPKPKVRIPRHRKPITVMVLINGAPTPKELVHIGAFSRAIGKSIPTVHQWERNGLLPKTPLYMNGTSKRERLFTAEMINVVKVEIAKRSGRVSAKDASFCKDVTSGWAELGVILKTSKIVGEMQDD